MSAATYLQPVMSQPTPASTSRRPAHRPTTYSGAGNYQSQQPPQAGSTTSYHHQPPIQPPPRTSSNRHQGGSANPALQPVPVTTNSSKGSSSRNQQNDGSRSGSRRDGDKRAVSTNAATGSSSRQEGTVPVRAESTREPPRRQDQEQGTTSNPSQPVPQQQSQQTQQPQQPQTRQERIDAARAERNGNAASSRKETRFGNYILGQTLGEGEFGKVKLGWRKDGGVQVAIKLIRRDTLAPHPNRLSKIYREISILRTLSHPNIVKLFEMIENERHIGIILEYASGGELFDYILTHRYLKDPPACRLFAQLVSGVGYLHKMGIVHRDLKLENLLLDRNRNIIITDFGFANVFDPLDDIGEYEDRLDDPNVLKELERGVGEDGRGRRGDLMATSCGSPCYAAPELVVSDGVYTGRKVDVWSCGVILYAMLAGYLPFDDDPANPEGDNINLLYKYIVSTPLTFPEYVTPHARDLLRRILVPDPRKRADLFEVARHSWLSPFANVVGLITSSTTTTQDIMTTTVTSDAQEQPVLTRSASVREPSTTTHVHASPQSNRHQEQSPSSKASGDTKRNTVQVEYVQPKTQTKRQQAASEQEKASKKERTPVIEEASSSKSKGKDREPEQQSQPSSSAAAAKPAVPEEHRHVPVNKSSTSGVPRTQAVGSDTGKLPTKHQQRATSYQGPNPLHGTTKITVGLPVIETHPIPAPQTQSRPATETRDTQTAESSQPSVAALPVPQTGNRPTSSETANSAVSRSQSVRQTSYTRSNKNSDPVVPQPLTVSSKVPQPVQKKPYTISNPIPQDPDAIGMTMSTYAPANPRESGSELSKGHKRANTVGGPSASAKIFDKMFGSSDKAGAQTVQPRPSMDRPSGQNSAAQTPTPRQSIEQVGGKYETSKGKRRFSLIPSWAHKNSDHGRKLGQGKLIKHDRRLSRSAGNATDPKGLTAQNIEPPASSHTTNGSYANINPEPTSQSLNSLPLASTNNGTSGSATNVANLTSKNRKFGDAYSHDGQMSGNSGSTGAARRVMDFFRKRAIGRSK
ncbi:hypothetical protein EYR41_009341 [Orbilia oligospora]|uniref:non-specific serine/threonine protein kinase n=1 Tax=Orbilia oligospora TaxID=2813651 RepID=A0A7C8NZS4_ORBOL|nr:hypothetical protein TWF751_001806 [Orbilia oligospora]TGJ65366.1 hypothetical protein EYR41_009341 [Orbilia oligospora]